MDAPVVPHTNVCRAGVVTDVTLKQLLQNTIWDRKPSCYCNADVSGWHQRVMYPFNGYIKRALPAISCSASFIVVMASVAVKAVVWLLRLSCSFS